MSYSSISKQIDSERYKETATSFRRYKISPFSTLVSWANGRRRSSRATVSRGYISVSAFGTSRAGVEDIHYSSLNLLDDGIDLYLDVYQYQSSMDFFHSSGVILQETDERLPRNKVCWFSVKWNDSAFR
jgi:hypothetical protein